MTPDRHRQLAEQIGRAAAKCGPADWEVKIEAAMLAGTHWANLVLHRRGVSDEAEDIVHTSMLIVNTLRKYSLAERDLIDALNEIEELRPLHVRGDVDGGLEAGDLALELLRKIAARAHTVIDIAPQPEGTSCSAR
ncbi:hypothetical protein [Rhodococcus opacus]|uniref:hypothetical protein n=1 Tax=Rhodococcus opacus TaxID=37919 RepID=UPI000A4ADD68|nr:hypothetical protein [Rhodococcus opacus]